MALLQQLKRVLVAACLLACFQPTSWADSDDPIIMRIDGAPIYRSEFEYFYNKNEGLVAPEDKKTVDEYVEMFVDYKLKVLAAREARLDTLQSFRTEFAHYRDLQLLPDLVDSAYIDSIAYLVYDRTAQQLGGQDMIRVAHILLLVPQSASNEEREQARLRCDSIYQALQQGADFAEMASRYSQDKMTARNGGAMPWIGPNMTPKEFEQAAYQLRPGQVSAPVASTLGFHLIKMLERKQLEPFAQLRPTILTALKRQGVEEQSAEHRIASIIKASDSTLTREMVLDSIYQAQCVANPDTRFLINEYHDGLLLYEISKRRVWDAAKDDEEGLEALYEANKKKYTWDEPRYRGFVIHAADAKLLKRVAKILKKDEHWRRTIRTQFNKDSVMVMVQGPFLAKKGENVYIDALVFDGPEAQPRAKFPFYDVCGKKQKKPASFHDVRPQVEEDYQQELESRWMTELRAAHRVEVDQTVVKTVNKH